MSLGIHVGVKWQREGEKCQPAPSMADCLSQPPTAKYREKDGKELSSSLQLLQMKLSRALCLKMDLALNLVDRSSTLWIQCSKYFSPGFPLLLNRWGPSNPIFSLLLKCVDAQGMHAHFNPGC